jgi:hypothetical protein
MLPSQCYHRNATIRSLALRACHPTGARLENINGEQFRKRVKRAVARYSPNKWTAAESSLPPSIIV